MRADVGSCVEGGGGSGARRCVCGLSRIRALNGVVAALPATAAARIGGCGDDSADAAEYAY